MKISGEKLKACREKACLSGSSGMEELSRVSGLGPRRLYQIEEHGGNMNLNIAKAIAKRLGCKLEDIAR